MNIPNGKMLYKYLTGIVEKHDKSYVESFKEARSRIERTEYAKGGEVLYHGVYCPNPVVDLVVGNSNRGRIIKRWGAKSEPSFTYGFDEKGEMITCEWTFTAEYLVKDGNKVLGIAYNTAPQGPAIEMVTECCYDEKGRIVSILQGCCMYPMIPMDKVDMETFEYDEQGIKTMERHEWSGGMARYLSGCRVNFTHRQDGFLKSCTWEDYDTRKKRFVLNEEEYDILKERKV